MRGVRRCLIGAGIVAVLLTGGTAGASTSSDEATAKALVITPADVAKADVGTKFRALPSAGESGDDASTDTFALLAACVGMPVPDRVVVATKHGPQLVDKHGHTQISSAADIVETKQMAVADRAVVESDAFPSCVGQLAERQGAANGITSAKAQRARVKRFGDYSTAVFVEAQGTTNGAPSRLTAVEVLTLRGRAELTASFLTDTSTPFDRVDAERVVDRVARRLAKAKV